MGKATGFLEYTRQNNIDRAPLERLQDYCEFHLPISPDKRRQQGARCMNCGVPLCQSAMKLSGMVTGCPLHNMIPEWNDQIYSDHMHHALSRLLKTSNFPEFTGRVCPALCEKASRSTTTSCISLRQLSKAVGCSPGFPQSAAAKKWLSSAAVPRALRRRTSSTTEGIR